MSDTTQEKTEATQEKPAVIRIKLKDKEYRRLSEAAREQHCTPEELVERCVQTLLES